jgi:hypothetical protein
MKSTRDLQDKSRNGERRQFDMAVFGVFVAILSLPPIVLPAYGVGAVSLSFPFWESVNASDAPTQSVDNCSVYSSAGGERFNLIRIRASLKGCTELLPLYTGDG